MGIIIFLILFPLVISLFLLLIKSDKIRGPLVIFSSIVIAASSIAFVVTRFGRPAKQLLWPGGGTDTEMVGYAMMAIEVAIAVLIIVLGIKYKKVLSSVLAFLQCGLLVWFEFTKGHEIEIASNLSVDKLSMIMVLIIGIIGTLICVYALGYMKDFAHHHSEGKDRRPYFFFLMFLFLSAMFGIVLTNNLIWMYFFWEITTLCSFLLIGYTRTPEAIRNSFRAVLFNLIGGLAFVVAIITIGNIFSFIEFDQFLEYGRTVKANGQLDIAVSLAVTLLAFAGITKAAQFPFSSWLLGAMVAPTPTSALLHSSTMVKAGVFMIIKLSPLLGVDNMGFTQSHAIDFGPGFMVVMVGGITFLMASFAAVSQSNAKRVLAYSTIANLGLIVLCAGIGTAAGVWAAIMLLIFHAVTKSLLFLSVGTAEHNIGSRDIEDMDGLFGRMPRLALFMIIGIAAMFLAPFGMLISKWAALQSVIDSGNVWVILMICFGSAITLFYWTKWLGKLSAIVANRDNIQDKVHKEEWASLGTHIVLVVLISLCFPIISDKMLIPYLSNYFQGLEPAVSAALSSDNMLIMVLLVAAILIIPLLFYGRTRKRIAPLYMAGVNKGDNLTFEGSMEQDEPVSLRNWYLADFFREKLMSRIAIIATCVVLTLTLSYHAAVGIRLIEYLLGGGAA
ncbi:MAG: NADH-quinone oxidoreductase subunit L [Clostridiales Family XIII bacterium]|nr:NADH-quinone oxidoreductase subunit L [Clostridiales Family XIII bacterium]